MVRWLVLVLVAAAMPAAAQRVSYEGGAQASYGKYQFTEPTTTFSLSTGLSVSVERLTARVSWPLWLQDNRLVTSSGLGSMPTGGVRAGRAVGDSGQARGTRRGRMAGGGPVAPPEDALSGFEVKAADPLLHLSVSVFRGDRVALRVSGGAKVPVSDTAGFGTGRWDAGGGLGASFFFGRSVLGIDAEYWHFGDLPDLDFRDVASASASFGRVSSSGWGWLASARATTTIIEGYSPPVSIGVGVSRTRGRGLVGASVGLGLTELAPDLTVGTFWTIRL